MVRMPVGDKYVLEEMVRLGASLGGEQSATYPARVRHNRRWHADGAAVIETAIASGTGLDELTATCGCIRKNW